MPGATFGMNAGGAYGVMGWMQGVAGTVKTKAYIDSVITYTHATLANFFNEWMDTIARMTPREFQHVYEVPTRWHEYQETVGMPSQRLWVHTLTGSGGTRDASFKFLPSHRPVPVDPTLLTPGKTGKVVKQGVHIFELKAAAMEYGINVKVTAKLAKMLAFPSGNARPNFRKGPVSFTAGGGVTNGKFSAAYLLFWQEQAPQFFSHDIAPTLEHDIANQASMNEAISLGTTSGSKRINIGASEAENLKTYKEAEALAKAKMLSNQTKYINAAAARRLELYGE